MQRTSLLERLEERKALELQLEALRHERDEQKALQQKARSSLRRAENELKLKEEALSSFAKRRQELERQSVRMRGELRGLKARLAARMPSDQVQQMMLLAQARCGHGGRRTGEIRALDRPCSLLPLFDSLGPPEPCAAWLSGCAFAARLGTQRSSERARRRKAFETWSGVARTGRQRSWWSSPV